MSKLERNGGPEILVHKGRRALVYLEAKPRREREDRRQDHLASAVTDMAIRHGDWHCVIKRMAALLIDGRVDDFDALIERVPAPVTAMAGERYLDSCG